MQFRNLQTVLQYQILPVLQLFARDLEFPNDTVTIFFEPPVREISLHEDVPVSVLGSSKTISFESFTVTVILVEVLEFATI